MWGNAQLATGQVRLAASPYFIYYKFLGAKMQNPAMYQVA